MGRAAVGVETPQIQSFVHAMAVYDDGTGGGFRSSQAEFCWLRLIEGCDRDVMCIALRSS